MFTFSLKKKAYKGLIHNIFQLLHFPGANQLMHIAVNGNIPDNKIHGANVGPTWVLAAPGGPHVGHMILAVRDVILENYAQSYPAEH